MGTFNAIYNKLFKPLLYKIKSPVVLRALLFKCRQFPKNRLLAYPSGRPLRKKHMKITCVSHVIPMCSHVILMCSHVILMCSHVIHM